MSWLRALAFNIYLQIWTLGMAFVFGISLLFSTNVVMRFAKFWARGVCLGAQVFLGIRAEIRGADYLKDRRVVLAAKHQSSWETLKLTTLVPLAATVLKRELTQIPVYGYYLRRTGMIPVDRDLGVTAIRSLIEQAKLRLDMGRTVIIYPEGTRVSIGRKPHYFPGVAALYKQLGVPVVPVALNSAVYWPRGSFVKIPGTIVIEALPPIRPGLDRKTFLKELEKRIETATARLVEEGRADLRRRGYEPP